MNRKLVIAGRRGRGTGSGNNVDRVNPVSRLSPIICPGHVAKVEHLSHAGGGGALAVEGQTDARTMRSILSFCAQAPMVG